jgi:hypothetical protein
MQLVLKQPGSSYHASMQSAQSLSSLALLNSKATQAKLESSTITYLHKLGNVTSKATQAN